MTFPWKTFRLVVVRSKILISTTLICLKLKAMKTVCNHVVNNNDNTLPPIPLPPPTPAHTCVRVQPSEPETNVENLFRVRSGVKNLPPRNSSPVEYFYLFFTNADFDMISRQTNYYANLKLGKKQNSSEIKQHSRLQKWVNITVEE